MGHSEDDAVHKIPHKMKMHLQNEQKILILIWFNILYRSRYKDRCYTCPMPLEDLEDFMYSIAASYEEITIFDRKQPFEM